MTVLSELDTVKPIQSLNQLLSLKEINHCRVKIFVSHLIWRIMLKKTTFTHHEAESSNVVVRYEDHWRYRNQENDVLQHVPCAKHIKLSTWAKRDLVYIIGGEVSKGLALNKPEYRTHREEIIEDFSLEQIVKWLNLYCKSSWVFNYSRLKLKAYWMV